MYPTRPRALLIVGLALALAACGTTPERTGPTPRASAPAPSPTSASPGLSTVPPVPSEPGQSLDPDQPPIVWVGGELTRLTSERLELREAIGSVITLRRLSGGATSFFRVVGGTWVRMAEDAEVDTGTKMCVETLMDGRTLLALRVFLGAECGPVA